MSDSRVPGSFVTSAIGNPWVSMITRTTHRALVRARRHSLRRRGVCGPTRPVVLIALIGLVSSVITAGSVALPAGAGAAGSSAGASEGQFAAIRPTRVLDTRVGLGAAKALVGGGSSVPVAVTGLAGVPTHGVAAVALTVTVVGPRAAGFLSVFGHGLPRPATSNLNFAAGQNVANLVVVAPGADGKVEVFNGSSAGANLLVDITGYYLTGPAAQPGGYSPVSPVRVLDTRVGLGAAKALVGGRTSVAVAVTGRAGVPTPGVAAVVLTVTVVGPRAAGFLTVFGHGLPRPVTSNLNFAAGQTVANLVVVAPGANGQVEVFNGASAGANLLVDISGYYRAAPAGQPGGYSPVSPVRVLDTRVGLGAAKALVGGRSSVAVAVTGRAGVPTSGVAAVVLTVTVVGPRAAGFLSVFGYSLHRPATSNLNFAAGQSVANLVVVTPGADGKVDLFNGTAGSANLLVDVAGYYVAPDQYASSGGGPGWTLDNSSETALTSTTVAGLQPAWNANQIAVPSSESPALVDGIAYIPGHVPGQYSGELEAVDAQTGQTLWSVTMPDCNIPSNGLTISAGMAFLGCTNSWLGTGTPGAVVVAIDLSTHKEVWARYGGGALAADGMVFSIIADGAGSEMYTILGLDAYTGQVRYQIPPLGPDAETSVGVKDGELFIASGSVLTVSGSILPGALKVYNDATGALLWTEVNADVNHLTLDAGHLLGWTSRGLNEWSEGGCGKANCAPNWTANLKAANDPRTCDQQPGGADGHTIAVTISCEGEGADLASSQIVLVDESTGAITHTIPLPEDQGISAGAVRSGNLLWVPGGHGPSYPPGFLAFDADCTTNCEPVVDLVGLEFADIPYAAIAVADGTVLLQTWGLGQVFAYRLN
jgi:hypothetical protein